MAIGTTTGSSGTNMGANVSVTFASNGTALAVYWDGSKIQFAYASAPYTSWTAIGSGVTASGMLSAQRLDTSDAVNIGYYISTGIQYVTASLSGTTYSLGTAVQIASQSTGGNSLMGGIMEKDSQNRYWFLTTNRAGSSILVYTTTTPNTAGWTSNLTQAWTSGTLNNAPCGGITGNFLLFIYPSASSTFQYRRLDVHNASLGSWSSATSFTPGGTSVTNDKFFSFRGNSTVGVQANDSGNGIWARVYDPSSDTFATAVQLSSTANDAKPTVVAGSDGNFYVFWQSFIASNNFSIVYKKYNVSNSTWDSSPTTVVASGANNFNVSGGSGHNTIGIVYQTGTGSPWNINFATVSLGTTVDHLWQMRGNVAALTDHAWAMRGRVSGLADHLWKMRGNVGTTVDHAWQMRGRVSGVADHLWRIRGNVAIIHAWQMRGRVANGATHLWKIRGNVGTTVDHAWAMRGRVSSLVNHQWAMRGHIGTRIQSGGFALFANGSGTVSFDSFRVTNYPDPSLDLGLVDRATSSLAAWNANLPTNTGLTVQTSLDNGINWSGVAASGNPIPGIAVQPDPVIDQFAGDSSPSYAQSNFGGNTGSWTWDTTNKRLVGSGGNGGTLVYNTALTSVESFIMADLDQADGSGLIANYQSASAMYYAQIWDASGTGTQNTVKLFRRSGGVSAQVGSSSIDWTRGRYKRWTLDVEAGVVSVSLDGEELISYADGSPLAAGKSGLLLGTLLRCVELQIQQYGEAVSDLSVCTRLTLTSTDPTATPQVLDLQAFVSSEDIDPGALVPLADHRRTYLSDNADDLNTKSATTWWYVRPDKSVVFRQRTATPAPWILDSANKTDNGLKKQGDLLVADLKLMPSGDLYRNRQTLTGVQAVGTFSETRTGDGQTRTWSLSNALAAPPTILLNGQVVTVGIKNVDTGRQYYWLPGSKTIDQDNNELILQEGDVLSFPNYTGSFTTDVVRDNATAETFPDTLSQQELAAIDQTSGIVENVLDVSKLNLDVPAAEAYGDQLLAQFGVIDARTLTFTTLRPGLAPGQDLLVFVPEQDCPGIHFLIVQVSTKAQIAAVPGDVLYRYTITATEGPALGSSWKLLSSLLSK